MTRDPESGLKKNHLIGDIRFSNIHFSYPSRPDVQVLDGLSFNVMHGQTVALVGPSGSGKSTCVQLLQRFYDPNSGSVLIDDNQVEEYNLKWLRQQIGVINQEPVLFQATIRENILLGCESATDEEVQKAAKIANAHNFIMSFPEKYETLVGQHGASLSGGQKQRIAIARALIRDPKILILDEATSALDNESERLVQEALYRVAESRTTLVITHRLSTIRNADKIVVIKNGKIIEEGNHEALMHMQGAYYDLVEAQKLNMNEEDNEQLEFQKVTTIIRPNQTDNEHLDERKISNSAIVNHNSLVYYPVDEVTRSVKVYEDFQETNKAIKKEKKINPTLAMLIMNKPEWLLIVIGCVACICNGGVVPGLGIVLSKLIASVLFAWSGESLTKQIRAKTFRSILRQDVAFIDDPKNNTGALCARLATEASAVQSAIGVRMGNILQNITTLGSHVAFVGASGSGKTTCIQLIERLYDVADGCLLVDSKDIRTLNLQWYRSQIGIVSQEPILFNMSIQDNIAYGDNSRSNIPLDEIIRAAQNANIHDFIQSLPDGYQTNCGPRGTQLSGGQKQRIAIARALLRNPKILLLDEATSALDSESEKTVQETLNRVQQNRTSITIAHRLSTIQNANVICVLHNGDIVESGTHGELLALRGRYYRLVHRKLEH
ncbi:unnamed protein product [Rotaria sp. Silwood1]|nr:unnamed protein product [Rotaria sp. Silwood1]